MGKMDHASRRKQLLATYPEVRALCGPEPRSKYLALVLVAAQLGLACTAGWWQSTTSYLAVAYVGGATVAQSLFLAVHELAHNLFFRSILANKLFSILVNLPLLFPFAIVFRTYHLLHHAQQGQVGYDMDLPSPLEQRAVRGPVTKALWLSAQLVFYALRPCALMPLRPTAWVVLNWAAQLAFNIALVHAVGWGAVRFLLLSLLVAGGLHPCAGHFLSEHMLFGADEGPQDTFSYYGPLNRLTWNVGYHVEHHDLPSVPGSRLPALRRKAAPFYEDLKTRASWAELLVTFVASPRVGLHSRLALHAE